ncbi:MAG: hypothetical protein EHM49_00740 [Deltaproteobacteria bacterium]|nr:MAG: hypothetical protein EHM49_00740 [Deltaproteobacteria bacterium]
MNENSVRDEVKDAIRYDLAGYFKIDISEVDAELIGALADSVFGALGIDYKEQDYSKERGTFVWFPAPSEEGGEEDE